MDLYPELVSYLRCIEPIRAVYTELPHGVELTALPCINLVSAGPGRRLLSMQGLGVDAEDIDVELYIAEHMWQRGDAFPIAQKIRALLSQFRAGQAKALDVTRPEKLPDRNPSIRRLGMTVSIMLPAIH